MASVGGRGEQGNHMIKQEREIWGLTNMFTVLVVVIVLENTHTLKVSHDRL